MFCNFDVGDHVVCVNGKFQPELHPFIPNQPAEGGSYVVRDIRLGINFDMQGDVSVLLVGLSNPFSSAAHGKERGFSADRFVKLSEYQEVTSEADTLKTEELQPA
jgi:hypothetical protein